LKQWISYCWLFFSYDTLRGSGHRVVTSAVVYHWSKLIITWWQSVAALVHWKEPNKIYLQKLVLYLYWSMCCEWACTRQICEDGRSCGRTNPRAVVITMTIIIIITTYYYRNHNNSVFCAYYYTEDVGLMKQWYMPKYRYIWKLCITPFVCVQNFLGIWKCLHTNIIKQQQCIINMHVFIYKTKSNFPEDRVWRFITCSGDTPRVYYIIMFACDALLYLLLQHG